jgi:hypothetical protein
LGYVSVLFCEKEKYYTIHEVSVLTGLSIREIHCTIKRPGIEGILHRRKNDTDEVIVPLGAMEQFVCSTTREEEFSPVRRALHQVKA